MNITYQEVIEWIVKDILASTESADDIEANVDRYMEDLADSVQSMAKELFEKDSA